MSLPRPVGTKTPSGSKLDRPATKSGLMPPGSLSRAQNKKNGDLEALSLDEAVLNGMEEAGVRVTLNERTQPSVVKALTVHYSDISKKQTMFDQFWCGAEVVGFKTRLPIQDNDSKHRSKSNKQWMAEVGMLDTLMVTPASSPDLNPIENVWESLKDYMQRHVKPTKKAELVNGIKMFWESLTPDQCGSYIDHMHVVLPVVLNSGGASGY